MSKLGDIRPNIRSILFVEDEIEIRESVKDVLELHIPDVTVVLAADGLAGIEAVKAQQFDVILSDFKMPGMDGLEFLAEARKLQPDAPRILITAYPELNVAMEAINAAAISNFLTKPVSPDTLLEALNAAVVKARRNQAWTHAFDGKGPVPLGTLQPPEK